MDANSQKIIDELTERGIDVSAMTAMEREYMGIVGYDGRCSVSENENSTNVGVRNNGSGVDMLEIPMVISAEQYSHLGKYAGAIVLMCFEKIGGMEAFAGWAKANPNDFYTKMFGKVIATSRTVETNGGADDAAMAALEADFRTVD